MITTISAIRTIHDYLLSVGVKSATEITGGVYWLMRPKSSQVEDIVINAIAMNAAQIQEGVFNVNTHVPNLALSTDHTHPNYARFDAIASILTPLLKEVRINNWFFYLDEPPTIIPDGSNWFCNMRIRFYALR